ncbi:WD40 repeat domain-containing protein [Streptomyces sp. PvR034]|uniref:WD40 repeat domain-containing protein n=1 Tax=Streptomyces sp. PvR034 TaxID=3156401 RepID=UPI0033942B7C
MTDAAPGGQGRRFLIAAVVADYPKNPVWNRPGLVEARAGIVELFTETLGYHHYDALPLNPTKQQLTDALNDFCCADDRRADDLLAVYLSLHGDVLDAGGEHVLLTTDTDPNRKSYTSLRTTDLARAMLQDTRVRRVMLMLDACYSAKGGNQLAAAALNRVESGWSRTPGSGLVVVSSAQPHQQAVAALFPTLLRDAVTDLSVAGHAPGTLSVNAVVQHVNDSKKRPEHQRIGLTLAGLDGEPPAFFPNPRHDVRLNDVDLALQQAASFDEQDRLRETELTARLLIRAMGHHSGARHQDANPQWWFSGRHAALAAIGAWLKEPPGPAASAARVVTAGPGSGKTAVLGVVAALSHPEHRRTVPTSALRIPADLIGSGALDTAIYAQRLTDTDVLHALGAAARVHATTVGGLLDALDGRRRPLTVLIDALDEAATPDTLCSSVLRPLLAHSRGRVRLLLGTRPYLLDRLGIPAEDTVDLDAPRYADREAVTAYAARILLGSHQSSPYRERPDRVLPVAQAVAAAADRSFLVARLAAFTLAAAPTIPSETGGRWRAGLPRHATEAMRQDLEQRLGPDARRATDLLRPLAWAQGQGLPWEDVWASLASEIAGRAYTDQDLMWLRRAAGSYVVEAVENGRSAYRLYHEAMAEHLRHDTEATRIHAAYTRVLSDRVPHRADATRDWGRAHPYALHHLAHHAAEADLLDALVEDPEYLVHVAPRGLTPHLRRVAKDVPRLNAAVYRAHLHLHLPLEPVERRQVLALDAARAGARSLHQRLVQQLPGGTWAPSWASGSRFSTAQQDALIGHGVALSVACTVVDGRAVAVSTGQEGTVRLWDLRTGAPVGEPLTGHVGGVAAVACTVVDDRPVAVTSGWDATVRVWDLRTGAPVGDPLTGHASQVHALACTTVDGRPVAVSGSWDGTVRVWDLRTGRPVGKPFTGHASAVNAVACAEVDGRPIAVTGGQDGTLRRWDLRTGRSIGERVGSQNSQVHAVACAVVDGWPIAVTGSWDGTVRVWDLRTGRPSSGPLTGHTNVVHAVACAEVDGRSVAVTGGWDGTVRVWDLRTGRLVREPLTGHTNAVYGVACAEVEGQPVVVTGGQDGTVRVWNPRNAPSRVQPLPTHPGGVSDVECVVVNGRSTVVTGGVDGAVRLWDADTGQPVGDPLLGHVGEVYAVACVAVDGRATAVTCGQQGTVLVWDLGADAPRGRPLVGHVGEVYAVACAVVDGRPVAVTSGLDGTVRAWDLDRGEPLGEPMTGHVGGVAAVGCVAVGGRLTAVTSGWDETVRVWDLLGGAHRGGLLPGQHSMVYAVACAVVDDRPMAIATAQDGSVRLWDLDARELVGDSVKAHAGGASAVVCGTLDGRSVAVTGGRDGLVRVWDLHLGASARAIFLDTVDDLRLTDSGDIVVVSGRDIAFYRRVQPDRPA